MKADSKLVESTLSEVCTLVTDGTHDTPKIVSEGIPLIKAKEIVGGIIDFDSCDKVTEEDHIRIISRSKPEYGDTLFAHIGASLGEAAYINTRKEFSIKNVALFKPDPDKIDGRYLYYLVKSPQFQELAKRNRTGSAQPFLSLGHLRSHKIKYHEDLETQQKIASILSAFDDLIENNTRRIEILEEMARRIYREWFVHFRYPGHEKDRLVDSGTELGEIPKGWEVKMLESFGRIETGKTPSKKDPENYGSHMPFIKTPDMHDQFFIHETSDSLSEKGAKSQSKKTLPANSICVSCIGTAGVVALTTTPSQTNQQINSIILKSEADREFLYYAVKSLKPVMEKIGSTGATMTNVSKGKFKKLEILYPLEELVTKFHAKGKEFFDQIKILQKQNIKLKETRDLLLPKLISGKIKIGDFTYN